MALGNKRTPRKLIKDRTGDGIINETRLNRVSSSLASEIFTDDPAIVDGPIAPVLYHTDLIQEDIDELRRYVTEDISSGGGGGGLTETPLVAMSGRATWSSTDSGELIHIGSSYGPFNYYVHAAEPINSTLRSFDSSQVIDTTTISNAISAYLFCNYGIYVPNESKQVKLRASWRLQNAPASSTWGWSIWSANQPSSGTASSNITLRARSSDITYGGSNVYTYFTTTTTTSAMNDTYIFPVLENRTGTLTATTYAYFSIQLFLV